MRLIKHLPNRDEPTTTTTEKWKAILKDIKKGKYPAQDPKMVSDAFWRSWWDNEAKNYQFPRHDIQSDAKKVSEETFEKIHNLAAEQGMTIGKYLLWAAERYMNGDLRYRQLNPNGCPNCREMHEPEVPEDYLEKVEEARERAEDFNPWEELDAIMEGEE